jgi:predicted TIM-barrel fold metal-dependent hydrolase
MATDLERCIQETMVCDTHEHQMTNEAFVGEEPDVIREIFQNYVQADFVSVCRSRELVNAFLDRENPDVGKRFASVADVWEAVRHTGYGEASRWIAREFFDIDEISAESLASAQEKLPERWPVDDRRKVFEEIGRIDHAQIDEWQVGCSRPDSADPEYFLYDLSCRPFCYPVWESGDIYEKSGVEVRDTETLREAMASIFTRFAPTSIGVKSQHAYSRTLLWEKRTDAEAGAALDAYMKDPEGCPEEAKLCLGDWSWARGVELCIEHDLPFKMHSGYYSGNWSMITDRIAAGHACPIFREYPKARFVVMHASYPYQTELVAIAKHFPNVWAEMSWAWSMNPVDCMNFVRTFVHGAPASKLLVFGGDCGRPRAAAAYAAQMRRWLTKVLQAEIDDGYLTEKQSMDVARRVMHGNQYEVFDVEGTRANIREFLA